MPYIQREFDDRVVLEPTAGAAPSPAPSAAPSSAPSACVIWLHGLGADGYDFVPIVPELALPAGLAVRFVFPHAPMRPVTLNGGARMRAWYDLAGLTAEAPEDAAGIRESASRIERYIRREREAGIPARRLVLAGFSQGGAIALYTCLRHPEPLGGVLALSTYLPLSTEAGGTAAGGAAEGAVPRVAQAGGAPAIARKPPILMCHGLDDPLIAVESAERSRDLLRARGYAVEWKSYPMAHQVCAEEIRDISGWLTRILTAHEPAAA